jgi:pSer/pThr/pTyr-binding forkhead associated (FHA) protein
MSRLSTDEAKTLPIFKVWADGGKHPPVALDKPVCVIGRNEVGVNLPLHAPQVSKLHAVVVRTQRKVYVRDLASRNGVQRNGEPVQEVGLSDEDVLRIGSYTLRCSSGFGRAPEAELDDSGAVASTGEPSTLPAAELVATNGMTYAFPPTHQTLLIGNRQGCEVRLDENDRVAPVHAIVFEIDGKRYVRDLGAPGGTHLNDRSIHQAELTPGDALRVGNVTLTYALVDPMHDDIPSLDPLGISDSLTAPSINLVDSTATAAERSAAPTPPVDPMVATGDSMILPEITMEDSTSPAPAAPARPVTPISEYDFDVAEADPRRESTFHGEVIAARPSRPELPPVAGPPDAEPEVKEPEALEAAAPTQDDAALPIAVPFHDEIIEDHLIHDQDDSNAQTPEPLPMGDEAHDPVAAVSESKPALEQPPERRAIVDRIGPAGESETATPSFPPIVQEVEALAAPAVPEPSSEAVEQVITQLVADVNEQVADVSEKVEVVAAKVERVTAKMHEVTRVVSDVAETAGALQEAWSEFQGGETDPRNPGASEARPADDQPENSARGTKRKNRKS